MHPDEYTPYGQRQVYTQGWLMSDLNGDGVVDSADESIVSAGSDPAADLDGDGDIDSADLALVQADLGQALPASDPLVTHPAAMSFRGDLAQTSGVALCPVGHQGLIHDEELGTSGGGSLIYNRARHLHPRLGRFMQRDPLGYVDGMSVYGYFAALRGTVDPFGLEEDTWWEYKASAWWAIDKALFIPHVVGDFAAGAGDSLTFGISGEQKTGHH